MSDNDDYDDDEAMKSESEDSSSQSSLEEKDDDNDNDDDNVFSDNDTDDASLQSSSDEDGDDNFDNTKKTRYLGGADSDNDNNTLHLDDDDDEDDDEDLEDEDNENENETYYQKFQRDLNKDYVQQYHPECLLQNNDEVSQLCIVVRDNFNIIVDDLHRTLPFLTKYERARVLGQRAKQIECGAPPLIPIEPTVIESYVIAEMELKAKKIPFIIRRPIPGGAFEYWKLADLELLTN